MRVIVLLVLLLMPTAAAAAPVIGAIGSAISAIQAFAAASWVGSLIVRVATSLAISALANALNPQQRRRQVGITTPYMMTGETNAESFILGKYATGGQLVYPPLTHGGSTGTEFKTIVVALSCLPGHQLQRISIGGKWAPFTGVVHADYGQELGNGFEGFAWVKYYDGSQVAADPMLVAKYGTHADYPWTADMIGKDICYAIITLKASKKRFGGAVPAIRFELNGLKLYDPRKDTTAGGVGVHRWIDQSTWEWTDNPVVMIYNILRGIDIKAGDPVWGGAVEASDLPYATWAAAMDYCDDQVALASGGTEPRYRAGYEIRLDMEPRQVIGEISSACSAFVADVGGRWIVRAGVPAVATMSITDDDIVVTDARQLRPQVGLENTHNAISATWIDPESFYQPKDAPAWVNQTALQEDGGRRLVADVNLPAVTAQYQVERLQKAWLADDRRWRTHVFTLPPRMVAMEPFDVITWTSDRNSYSARPFEVVSVTDDPLTLNQRVTIREVDYSDWV